MATTNLENVKLGLKALDVVFNKNQTNYRVLGSVLVAALNGKPHRTLGDIDVLVEKKDFNNIVKSLESIGYSLEKKAKWGFHWYEAGKDGSLGFTFLLIGQFTDRSFSCHLSRWVELRISASYLTPTKYSLFGISFTGIPHRSIYEGLKASSLNPKRSLDRAVVLSYFKGKMPEGEKLEKSFTVFLLGREIPHLYPLFSWLYNIFGRIRVLLGKKYEVWS